MANKQPLALRLLIGICAVSFVSEVLLHRHSYFELEATPFFFVLYGLICLALALLMGAVLARFVARPLDYYDADMHGDVHGDKQEDGDA